jgi:hypothetical protein
MTMQIYLNIYLYIPWKSFGNLTGKIIVSSNAVLAYAKPMTSSYVTFESVTIDPVRNDSILYVRRKYANNHRSI